MWVPFNVELFWDSFHGVSCVVPLKEAIVISLLDSLSKVYSRSGRLRVAERKLNEADLMEFPLSSYACTSAKVYSLLGSSRRPLRTRFEAFL